MVTINQIETCTLGDSARKVRLALHLTQRQLADMSGISRDSVYQFEHHLPVCLDSRRKILKELWAYKTAKHAN